MHRASVVAVFVVSSFVAFEACGGGDDAASGDDTSGGGDAAIDRTSSPGDGAPTSCASGVHTTISGTVVAPNGTMPIAGASVYVPSGTPAPLAHGVGGGCGCITGPSNAALTQATTDANGHFSLEVPEGDNLPVIIEKGKWQRFLVLKTAPAACVDTALPADDTRLPRSMTDLGGDTASVTFLKANTAFSHITVNLLEKPKDIVPAVEVKAPPPPHPPRKLVDVPAPWFNSVGIDPLLDVH